MNLFVEGRGAALSTEFLLDFYEQQIAKTGKSLRSWLIDINASTRYEAVKALRSRRKAGSSN